jgi:hypothetical protein
MGNIVVAFANLDDQNLLRYYENIRDQVERDAPYKFKLTSGPSIRQHADELRAEIARRRLQHSPINWQSLWGDPMARKRRAAQWSMKDDRELIELAAASLDDLAAHFNRPPAIVIKRGRRLGVYLKAEAVSRKRPSSNKGDRSGWG